MGVRDRGGGISGEAAQSMFEGMSRDSAFRPIYDPTIRSA